MTSAWTREVVRVDVLEFEAALESGEPQQAVEVYAGPFLDGFYLNGSGEFERWAEGERDRLAREYQGALEELAREAGGRGAVREAVEWWRRLATEAPYDARVAVALMEALAAAGDRAGALRQAEAHATLLEEEFGAAAKPGARESGPAASRGTGGESHRPLPSRFRNSVRPRLPPPSEIRMRRLRSLARRFLRCPPRRYRREWITAFARDGGRAHDHRHAVQCRTHTRGPAGRDSPLRSTQTGYWSSSSRTRRAMRRWILWDRMAADWIARELAGTGLVKVVPSMAELGEGSPDSALGEGSNGDDVTRGGRAQALARQAGTGVLVSGAYYRRGRQSHVPGAPCRREHG